MTCHAIVSCIVAMLFLSKQGVKQCLWCTWVLETKNSLKDKFFISVIFQIPISGCTCWQEASLRWHAVEEENNLFALLNAQLCPWKCWSDPFRAVHHCKTSIIARPARPCFKEHLSSLLSCQICTSNTASGERYPIFWHEMSTFALFLIFFFVFLE